MEELLREILEELRELNRNVETIIEVQPLLRPIHDLDQIYDKIEEVGDQITGGSSGIGGSSLADLKDELRG